MKTSLPALRYNNFDLLRVVFAMMVCLVHISELSGNPAFDILSAAFSSSLAVKAFFVVSGFLIFMSYERADSLRDYAGKRVRRIYPAYVLVILICAFGLPALMAPDPLGVYFSAAWLKYVIYNAVFLNFLQPTLPGVFTDLKVQAVNGALWTLKVEVMFYIAVPFLAAAMGRFGRGRILIITYVLSLAYGHAMQAVAESSGRPVFSELARQLPGQLAYFMAGAALYYYFPEVMRRWRIWVGIACAILLLNRWVPLGFAEPLALGMVVVGLAFGFYFGHFSRYGDFSYGLYIVHFPIIQSLLWWGGLNQTPAAFLLVAVGGTLLTAFLLWHGVERRFIARGGQRGGHAPSVAARV